jgi:hypothetical protein
MERPHYRAVSASFLERTRAANAPHGVMLSGGAQSLAARERIADNTDVKLGNPGQLLHEIAAIAKQRDSASTAVLVAGVGKAAAVNTIARLTGLDLRRLDIGAVSSHPEALP